MAKKYTVSPQIEKEILEDLQRCISEGDSHCPDKHTRNEENGFYARGEQWTKEDLYRQKEKERPAVPWNSVFKILHAIANREMIERFSPKVFGASSKDGGVADVLNEACRWQRKVAYSEHFESMAFRSAALSGYGCMHKFWSPGAMNGDGMIADEDVPIWEMLWPVAARQTNLSDRRWHLRGKWMDIDTIDALFGDGSPKARKKIKNWKGAGKLGVLIGGEVSQQIKPLEIVFGWDAVRAGQWINKAKEQVFVVEYEWIDVEKTYKAIIPERAYDWIAFNAGQPIAYMIPPQQEGEDPQQGQMTYDQYLQMDLGQQDQFKEMILGETKVETFNTKQELMAFVDAYENATKEDFTNYEVKPKEVVKFAIVSDNTVLEYGERPMGFTYHFITGFPFETKDGMDFFGVVDIVKGPQDYKNALLSNMLAMYMSSPKSPILVEKGAVPNLDELANKLASPSGLVTVPNGFIQSGKFMVLPAPTFPEMAKELLALTTSGVEESIGLSSIDMNTQGDLRRISGTVVQAAKTASNVIVAALFDALRMFRKQYGLCNIKFIHRMYSIEEIIRIVGEEKMEDVQTLPEDWGDIFRYDIVIDEQPSSPSEMMELVDFLTRTGTLDRWLGSGYIAFEDVLRIMPQIPESEKRQMLKNKTLKDQLMQSSQQLKQIQEMSQAMTQFFQKDQAGIELLQKFMAMWQARMASSGQQG